MAARQLLSDRRTDPHGQAAPAQGLQPGTAALAKGPSAGLPRVYDIALETISHGDGRVDPESLSRFVAAYQTVTALKLGELWAIPIMLRLALIENLRRVAARIAADRIDRDRADHWADQMTEIAEKDPKSLILVIADMARSNPPMVSAFVAELARRLQGQGPALALPLTWIEQRLSESGLTIEQLVQSENQQQAADQVSISNSIGSLRFLGAMDWREFVETMSVVEQTLREDPGGVYGRMDFATRDRYRHAVEKIAKSSRCPKARWRAKRSDLRREGAAQGRRRRSHGTCRLLPDRQGVGRSSNGRRRCACLSLRPSAKASRRFPLLFYLGTIALITASFTGGLLGEAHRQRAARLAAVRCWASSRCLCTSQLAVALVNWLATLLATPRPLPRMDFSDGIPPESRTLVVVPTMLTSAQNIEDLIEALEVRFLANRDDNLHFGLLTDFRDAHEETLPEDEPLLLLARQRIEELNEKYSSVKGRHVLPVPSPAPLESARADLDGLRAQARQAGGPEFAVCAAAVTGVASRSSSARRTVLSDVKYVITLDTDTQLPRDAARQFVGAMAHPLNRPRYDEAQAARLRRVRHPAAARGREPAGHEPLALCAPVGQRAGHRSLYPRRLRCLPGSLRGRLVHRQGHLRRRCVRAGAQGRFPENRILSHDLLEGCYARAGLLSDVQLYEEYPSRYSADVSRRHRWIRGDWQIARWLLPWRARPRRRPPEESALRTVALEDLRQPAAQPGAGGADAAAAAGLDGLSPAWFWTLAVLGIILIPPWWPPAGSVASRKMCCCGSIWPPRCARPAGASRRRDLRSPVCPTRPLQPGCDPAHALAAAGHTDGCWNGIRRATRSATAARIWPPPSGRCGSPPSLAALTASIWRFRGRPRWRGRAHPGPLVRLAGHRLVDQPAACSPRSQADAPTRPFFSESLRARPGRSSRPSSARKITGCRRTTIRNIPLPRSPIAPRRPTWDWRCWRICPRTTSATSRPGNWSSARPMHCTRWKPWSAIAAISTTGTTRSRCSRCRPLYISTVDSGNLAGHLLTLRPGLLALPDHKILERGCSTG